MPNNRFVKEELEKILSDNENCTDVFLLVGEINLSIIASSIVIIENKLKLLKFSKSLISRTKLISIELLDNILKHQYKNKDYKPFFQVVIYKEKMSFVSGNCINTKNYNILKEKLNSLSTLKPDQVQKEYMERLQNNELDEEGNAGLGLLTIMKKNHINFDYNLIELPNNYYFYKNSINLLNLN